MLHHNYVDTTYYFDVVKGFKHLVLKNLYL